MTGYIGRRLAQAVVILAGVTVITFVLLHLLPGGPALALLGTHKTPGAIAALNRQLGLDRPLVIQYFIWVGSLVRGNLGFSYVHELPVTDLIRVALPNSTVICSMAIAEALLIAIPLGVYQALHPRTVGDTIATAAAFILYSMPIFFIGALLILFLSVHYHVFPSGGVGPVGSSASVITRLQYALLPSLTLAVVQLAAWSRYMRSSMLDTLVQDYIRTARAKGLTMSQSVWRHGMRNALLPIIQLVGLSLATLIGGVVVVESVFNYPGMGYLLWQGAQQYDFPVVLGVTVISAIAVVLGNLAADIAHAIVDPRIRDVVVE